MKSVIQMEMMNFIFPIRPLSRVEYDLNSKQTGRPVTF